MDSTLDVIASGLDASQTMMNTIADNLANVNTTGFKEEVPEFQTLLYQNGIQPGGQSTGQTVYPSGLELGTGVQVSGIKDVETQGSLTTTNNPTDLAINGAGYFQILQPNGQIAYTRDGSFQPNQNGQLVNANGYQVIPNITIPINAESVTIGLDGTVSVTTPGSNVSTQVGQLQLANFINPQGLQPLGNNLYAQTTASGNPVVGAPQTNGLGSINQDMLESSNVDVVDSMVDMISAERAYQLGTQAASAVDNQLSELAQAASGCMSTRRSDAAKFISLAASGALVACTHAPGPITMVKPAEFPVTVAPQTASTDGSVFPNATSGSLYEPRRDWRIGDLVTIDIVTATTANDTDNDALKRAGTVADTLTSFMGVPLNFGFSANGTPFSPSINASSNQTYTGAGSAAATSNVTGQVEAVITHIDPNGTLALAGRTNVNVNGNVTSIVVTGYASPDDIAANTTISSNNVADMNVQYVGNGPINAAHQVPWLQQILSKAWPF